ncbi:MAG TPA: sensor domain-containing diguanylate cyclase [Candidatus Limnocylindria bacterium]|nr:sensor domain-containing diguanylate cyclase [Candidatus Limnocylindria bacterium]
MSRASVLVRRRSTDVYLIGSAAVLAVFVIGRLYRGEPVALALTDVAFTAFGLLALAACLFAAARTPPAQRLGWRLLAAGSAGWTAGHIVIDAQRIAIGPVALSDLLFLIAAPIYVVAFFAFLFGHDRHLNAVALAFDAAAVSLTLFAGFALFLPDLFADLAVGRYVTAIAIVYPLLYTAATAAAISALWGLPHDRPRGAYVSLTIGMALNALAFTLWLPGYLRQAGTISPLLEPVWMLGMLAIAGGAYIAVEDHDRSRPSQLARRGVHFLRLVLPAVVALSSAYILVASQLDDLTRTDRLVAIGVAATVVLIATRVGLALYWNYLLTERERRLAVQYQVLYDVGLDTANEHSVDELVRLIVDRATDLTRCDGSALALEEPGQGLVWRALRKASIDLRDSVGEPMSGIGRAAAETREVVVAPDYRSHAASTARLHDVIASAMSAPLIVRGQLIGVLNVYSRLPRTFGGATQQLFRLYAAQAAVVLANARLLAESRMLASHDSLTGVLNRRSLVERLELEVAEARRHGDAFCVLMCDLDGLKQVNDSAGHLVGDDVLRRVAQGIREAARTEDSVARFGGDEFVLLLPRTSLLQGQALGARLGAKLRDMTYVWGGRDEPLPRVSIGIASFPDDGLTADTLIAAADARMYADKSRARGLSRADRANEA